jgi:hypothetical protein
VASDECQCGARIVVKGDALCLRCKRDAYERPIRTATKEAADRMAIDQVMSQGSWRELR